MKDTKRIKLVLKRLEKVWLDHPDLRLGQLLMGITRTGETNPKLFYMEEEELLQKLDAFEKTFENRLKDSAE
jgi:uncharacterized protein YihD (DUF1040 family)